jgi:hypothetical protein
MNKRRKIQIFSVRSVISVRNIIGARKTHEKKEEKSKNSLCAQ